MLNTIETGTPGGTPLLIVHGLFGSGRNWGVIAKRLSDKYFLVTPDMRNHGDSPQTQTHSYLDLAADLAEVIDAYGGRADVVGHSMGGKAAMALALTRPEMVGRLIVADIAPVSYGHSQMQFIDAMRKVDLTRVTRRSEAVEQLAQWVDDKTLQSFFTQSLDVPGQRWKYNLDTLAAEMPKILSFPEIEGAFDGPTLFLSGGQSEYVRPEHRAQIRAFFPKARFAKIPGAGHWLHAEKPREFEASVRGFLDMTA
ncbi:alpha/beta fold hydrolase [Tropicibacter naphthalenivorans]|uniref:Esterase YbfF n=1 Tax=Tropicibacter naphthalenivorans TaxID=441103 RepID=A0A0P1GK20_9RHOB|nr:alpha/beta fold hydrolase [Tropicibacter naphthalenivorans]CUH82446.1 Esterase YbfF [Tropicibacter naphthalenivorans]SMD06083.1 Pimeloyl-ACP methyl ester carboxylesterase [Tropicibacter naphthalenivorans]